MEGLDPSWTPDKAWTQTHSHSMEAKTVNYTLRFVEVHLNYVYMKLRSARSNVTNGAGKRDPFHS